MDPSAAENEAQEDLSATETPAEDEAETPADETAAAEQPQGDTHPALTQHWTTA